MKKLNVPFTVLHNFFFLQKKKNVNFKKIHYNKNYIKK